MKLTVLWIDDQPTSGFMDLAYDEGLDIVSVKCYSEGLKWLKQNKHHCDAVILDVNCKETDDTNESPDMKVFEQYFHDVISICESNDKLIPWFVFTGGGFEGFSMLERLIPQRNRNWIKKTYYNKNGEDDLLIKNIKETIANNVEYLIELKYDDVISAFPKLRDDLKKVFIAVENNRTTEPEIIHIIRKILESTIKYMQERGLIVGNITKLSELQKHISFVSIKDNTIIPTYISYRFCACIETTQNASHRSKENSELILESMLKQGVVPYLIRCTMFEILDLLTWISLLPTDEKSIKDRINKISQLYKERSDNKNEPYYKKQYPYSSNKNYN